MFLNQLSESEYHPYFQGYISMVGEKDMLTSMEEGMSSTLDFFRSIPGEKLEYRYEPGKWTVKDILQHLIDSERMFCFRAMSFARSENAVLPGYNEDEFASNSRANQRSLEDLLAEYEAVRRASMAMFASFDSDALKSTGIANGNKLSARAAGFLICGHEIHHKRVIEQRYL